MTMTTTASITTNAITAPKALQKSHTKRSQLFEAQAAYLQIDPGLVAHIHAAAPDSEPVLIRGSKCMRTTVGRGHNATVQIGRSNKRVSRQHVAIEHKPQLDGFELTILSPNGALIDRIVFVAGEHVPLIEGTTIEILGTRLIFLGPTEDGAAEEKSGEEEEEEDKKHKKKNNKQQEQQRPLTASSSSSSLSPSPLSSVSSSSLSSSSVPTCTPISLSKETVAVAKSSSELRMVKEAAPFDLMDSIVKILACSRKTSMTLREIVDRLKMVSSDEVLALVKEAIFIGRIERRGKTADGSPKEDLFYYQAEKDPIHERRKKYSQIGRGARKCTMKDTQYFFRIPPKLPNHRGRSYVPPPAAANKKRRTMAHHHAEDPMEIDAKEEEDEEDIKSTSSGGVSDQEVGELFKDV
ncbi:hypothetical protein EC973_004247 [Apophysomyces ossiformis]|uniref:FHA domain-containing protein n=1 Tax=Apophysomyces ossiformis TaxID=679940 RepID=A0A8H7BX11_9FUNG|nr:hypothetical protein EC973_004247 [Apophysomyces ossiformis]